MADLTYTACTDDLVSGGVLRIPVGAGTGELALRRRATRTSPASLAARIPYSVASNGGVPFAVADTSVGRVNRSAMSMVNVGNASDLRNLLASNLTNKRITLQSGDYLGYFEQTGNWTNVELASDNQNARFLSTTSTTNLLFQGGATRKQVAITGPRFESTMSGTGYPQLWWNELGSFDGLEFAYLDLTCPNGAFNAMGCTQYSTSSNQGNIAKNIFMHHLNLHEIGRVGIELLSQGYDGIFRLFNLAIQNCTFDHLGLGNEYGMATSLSGLFRQVDVSGNNATRTRRIGYEFVNTQQVTASNNNLRNGTDGVGYGISDDDHGLTQDIYVAGGIIEAPERPFYCYEGTNINFDGQNQPWKGGRGVDIGKTKGGLLKSLNLLVQSTAIESSFQVQGSCSNLTVQDSKISSAGSAAAGRKPAYEAAVIRSGATGIAFKNVQTVLGTQANGQPLAPSPETGADGRIVDQGSNNTITNNSKSVVA